MPLVHGDRLVGIRGPRFDLEIHLVGPDQGLNPIVKQSLPVALQDLPGQRLFVRLEIRQISGLPIAQMENNGTGRGADEVADRADWQAQRPLLDAGGRRQVEFLLSDGEWGWGFHL